jgi:hypothetical protein
MADGLGEGIVQCRKGMPFTDTEQCGPTFACGANNKLCVGRSQGDVGVKLPVDQRTPLIKKAINRN